eukprot:1176523-Prorocentrum_minimum.AAC.3
MAARYWIHVHVRSAAKSASGKMRFTCFASIASSACVSIGTFGSQAQWADLTVKCGEPREPQKPTTKSEEYQRHIQGVLYTTRGAQTSKTRCYQRCEHPGFPGASSVCNVLVPWTNPRGGWWALPYTEKNTRTASQS